MKSFLLTAALASSLVYALPSTVSGLNAESSLVKKMCTVEMCTEPDFKGECEHKTFPIEYALYVCAGIPGKVSGKVTSVRALDPDCVCKVLNGDCKGSYGKILGEAGDIGMEGIKDLSDPRYNLDNKATIVGCSPAS